MDAPDDYAATLNIYQLTSKLTERVKALEDKPASKPEVTKAAFDALGKLVQAGSTEANKLADRVKNAEAAAAAKDTAIKKNATDLATAVTAANAVEGRVQTIEASYEANKTAIDRNAHLAEVIDKQFGAYVRAVNKYLIVGVGVSLEALKKGGMTDEELKLLGIIKPAPKI